MRNHEKAGTSKSRRRRTRSDSRDSESPKPAEKPVSLHPLEFEDAVKGLFQVKRGKKGDRRSNVQ